MSTPHSDQAAPDPITMATLPDVEDRVYAIGLDLEAITMEDLKSMMEAFNRSFDKAEFVVVGMPIEGAVEISEMDPDEIQDVIDYGNVMKDVEALDD